MTDEPVEEVAIAYSGGSWLVRSNDPELEKVYPTEQYVEHAKGNGMSVFRRRIIVVEDWMPV